MLREQFLVDFRLRFLYSLLDDGLDAESMIRVLIAEVELKVGDLGLGTLLLSQPHDVFHFRVVLATPCSLFDEVVLHRGGPHFDLRD